ncbi:cupin domain-containing protein [Chitinivibrio alkaliphilus]|uniref:Enzyme of the cupin superfamily n=1 Tax=Chitinivibrio alkaliphilus ACht1 TaxID=1313304 RepID=U7DDZ4_9BACT|nr:cupin domain-containing protein [Chitinivibrio alkaliphilus]ERP39131.1 enzyme of the cupin superfamily [Chitinivibrio alkaliphilus ACht1]
MADKITITRNPAREELDRMGVFSWPIWEKEVSCFPWTYDAEEVCYILQGAVRVTTSHGEVFYIEAGDLVTFPQGLSCEWDITADLKKHYSFV